MRHDRIFKGAVKTTVLGLAALLGASLADADYVNYGTMINGASVDAVPPSSPTKVTTSSGSVTFQLNGSDPNATSIKLVNFDTTGKTGAGASYNYAGGDGIFIPIGTINVPVTSTTPLTTINDLHFSFQVNLNDFSNPQLGSATGSGTFTVSGDLSGSIGSANQQGTALNLKMTDYQTNLANNQITIGNTTYEVLALNASNYFNAPTTAGAGTFQIHIRALPASVPEPGSLVMMGLGGCLGLAGLARRRRNRTV